jgi:hypothetical protein
MTIREILSLDFEPCNLDELLALMDMPGYFEVSNYYKLFNYLPLDESKVYGENLFLCSKNESLSDSALSSYIYYKLSFNGSVLFVCQYYMNSLSVALLDKSIYILALDYLVNSLDQSLLETKDLGDNIL